MPAAVATTATAGEEVKDGIQAMNTLKSTDPPLFLSPSEQLSNSARLASGYLYDSLKPYAPKSPFTHLLVNGFDAEQIWQQIDLQSQPLVSSLRRRVKKLENNPDEHRALVNLGGNGSKEGVKEASENGTLFNLGENGKKEGVEEASEDEDDVRGFVDYEELEDIDEDEEDEDEDDDGIDEEEEGGGGIEDRFLKKKEMKKYLDDEEDAWYGKKKKKGGKKRGDADDDADEEGGDEEGSSSDDDEMDNVEGEEDEDEDEDEDDKLGMDDAKDDGSEDELGKARYDDFFGTMAKAGQKRKSKPLEVSDDLDMDEPSSNGTRSEKKQKLSTHEKEREKIRSTIEEMEKANMETKAWTMQGEVTAAKRPKNSALETDLDFDHNARPPPVITEEVTESLEEIIKKRILEAHFDDVQKPQALPSKAPREAKELDENKSKKGLAEIYEEEYVQKSGLVSTSMSFSDQQKKEAANLFKELCVKLDALSHFHFTPKPVIEDMSIQANVPALAMEEIAPLAVSDAAMLAPEEVFSGKGEIKEEKELTQAERKRRRAKKKRKFKAVTAKKNFSQAQRQHTLSTDKVEGNEES